ncbi:hypothetical protein [Pelagicoccus mobilis]|uniref:Lipoprotein n=1 Tax=Pelagicoccus mobilis TaxID=415221 RepID=A0A934VRR5_9BACT|nr:hypothetical protein [Pelagicoccus mobilis]MBK1879682.1 hypothetical protein [Pelagicoccus mobilis]
MRNPILKALVAALVSLFLSCSLFSDHHKSDEKGAVLGRGYTFEVKMGSQADFQKAFAEHVQWRRDNGDTWGWECFVVVNGPDLGNYHVRSYPHSWADFDEYYNSEFGKKASEHWYATVAPHLESIEADIAVDRQDLSKWTDGRDYEYFTVNTVRTKIGRQWDYLNAIEQIGNVLKETESWDYDWSVSVQKAGGVGNNVWLVFPSEDWAGMEDPSPNAYEVVLEALGEEKTKEIFDQLNDSVAKSVSNHFRHLPDYSIKAAE